SKGEDEGGGSFLQDNGSSSGRNAWSERESLLAHGLGLAEAEPADARGEGVGRGRGDRAHAQAPDAAAAGVGVEQAGAVDAGPREHGQRALRVLAAAEAGDLELDARRDRRLRGR